MRRLIAVIAESLAHALALLSTIQQEIRTMSNTVSTNVLQLTAVVEQLKDDVTATLSKIEVLQGAKAGDTITSDQEAAIGTAVSALQGLHTALTSAPTTSTADASGTSTVSGSTDTPAASATPAQTPAAS